MHNRLSRVRIGLRTIKTVVAVIVAMVIVNFYGASPSKLLFAMLGAMAAVQPTFKDSVESCQTQVVGGLFGGLAGVVLVALPLPMVLSAGIGVALVILVYNALRIRFSPSLPCFIVVMLCTTPDILPMEYALGRFWDSAIGLGVGMIINSLVFPYDNRREIRSTMESLDRELILFLEDLFDGDDHLPGAEGTVAQIDGMDKQLKIFAKQKLLMRPSRQKQELEAFRAYEGKAMRLVAHMQVLCRMEHLGRLDEENRRRLEQAGANITDRREMVERTDRDIVTNYHVQKLLELRRELMDILKR